MLLFATVIACALSHHAIAPVDLGSTGSAAAFEQLIDVPGPLHLTTVASANWEVPLSGLLDLHDPKAVAAGLTDHGEPIQVYFHAIEHPDHGLTLVDTGVGRALRDDPKHSAMRGPVSRAMHLEKMDFLAPLGDWLNGRAVAAVFLTHMHLDHISGMDDVPAGTPIYTGPGESRAKSPLNLLVRPPTDRQLDGKGAIHEWAFQPDPSGHFDGLLDIFGDGSLWAIAAPGHTPGSTAYLARTTEGPVLMTGDASHTRWGWDNGVGPGSYSADQETGMRSLGALRALAARHPAMVVRLGHQG